MQTIIWAVGATLVILLILSISPFGFTIRGKFIMALTCFIISLGGLISVSSFSLWQIALMLVVLVFFSAYFLDKRLGTYIYKINSPIREVEEEHGNPDPGNNLDNVLNGNINGDLSLPEASLKKNIEKESIFDTRQTPGRTTIEKSADNGSELFDEEIAFLLERNIESEVSKQTEDKKPIIDNLKDNGLLESESETDYENLLSEIQLPSPIVIEKILPKQIVDGEETLEDSFFDFLLAQNEVARLDEEELVEIRTKEKVTSQK
jgi:hypothetical protein